MTKKYDVTVIIPMYNASQYLRECLDSIEKQKTELKVEKLLIDDGSSDNSLAICEEYHQRDDDYIIFHHNHQGISYSRNIGIKKARGKYILMLDSDDFIGENTLENLFSFFSKNEEQIDIATYPLFTFNENKKYHKLNVYDCFNDTGIYSVCEYPFFTQDTTNIMFKNDKHAFYDEKLIIDANAKFNLELIMNKGRIGYVNEAAYYYRKPNDDNFHKQNPYYCLEEILACYDWLLKKYVSNHSLPLYIQSFLLTKLNYRIKTDNLLPYYLDKEAYEHFYQKIKEVVSYISPKLISDYDQMAPWHRYYLFLLQNKKLNVKFIDNKYLAYLNDELVETSDDLIFNLNHFKIRNNKIEILGIVQTILSHYYHPYIYLIYIDNDDQTHQEKLPIFKSNYAYDKCTMETVSLDGFKCSIDMDKVKKFAFCLKYNDHKFYGKYVFSKWVPFNQQLKRNLIISNNFLITFSCNKINFEIKKASFSNSFALTLKQLLQYVKINPKILMYRLLHRCHLRYNIWLYNDSKGIFDNAYIQFKHDFSKHDGVKRYYIYRDDYQKIKYKFTEEEQKYLVAYGSLKHKKLYLNSSKILTSFSDDVIYSPFGSGIKYYNDLTNYDLIYLQHGILHASLKSVYSKELTEIDKIVISSSFERENLINNYKYDSNDLIVTGMSRLEKPKNNDHQKKIAFIPSWRHYLIGEYKKDGRRLMSDYFLKSDFYQKINTFLQSPKLHDILAKNDYVLEFKLHPIFSGYKDMFCLSNDRIILSFDEIKVNDYALCITDFSSFQFDFVWNNIPVIYFVPDMKEFVAGLHTYRSLDLSYDNAFGPLCAESDTLLQTIEAFFQNDLCLDKKYQERMHNFFLVTSQPPEEIYNFLINSSQK